MGNCTEKDGKQRVYFGPIKPEPNRIKIRCIEIIGGPTRNEFTIDDKQCEKAEDVYNLLQSEIRLGKYSLIDKEIAAFYNESENNKLVLLDDGSKLYHNKVYSILVFKNRKKKFKFRKHSENIEIMALQLTSAGAISEENEELEFSPMKKRIPAQ